jgi:hypothetical protein
METLRNERIALEESISSLRKECEALRSSLNNEFTINDNLRMQMSRITKGNKEIEEQKIFLLQSLYKRLIPITISNKNSNFQQAPLPTDLREEKQLEEFIDRQIEHILEHIHHTDYKLEDMENDMHKKEEILHNIVKKNEDQITKLTRIIIEKENQYKKEKDALVAYYEQLLNDVNSRVKVRFFNNLNEIINLNKLVKYE